MQEKLTNQRCILQHYYSDAVVNEIRRRRRRRRRRKDLVLEIIFRAN
jgi:hypothetical protein